MWAEDTRKLIHCFTPTCCDGVKTKSANLSRYSGVKENLWTSSLPKGREIPTCHQEGIECLEMEQEELDRATLTPEKHYKKLSCLVVAATTSPAEEVESRNLFFPRGGK